MKVRYINLDRAAERRQELEANFARCDAAGWTLARFAAFDAGAPGAALPPSRLRPAAIGCFLSHRDALAQAAAEPGHAMIVEDDAQFGPSSQRVIDEALRSLTQPWDLLFTDVCVSNFQTMVDLFLLRRERAGSPMLLPLSGLPFAGTTAYVVNERSKSRLASLVAAADLALPYDLWLRQEIYAGRLAGFVTFPFATTLSTLADRSQLRAQERYNLDAVRNAYRRLVWCDADPGQELEQLAAVDLGALAADEAVLVKLLAAVITGRAKGRSRYGASRPPG